nr:hypothetical protein [Tanacetum cinerariifolium]
MDTLSLVSKYLKDLEECMDDGDSKIAKEAKLYDALEHKSVLIEVDNQKTIIFTEVPLRAFGEPFMRYFIPCKVDGQGAWDVKLDLTDLANYVTEEVLENMRFVKYGAQLTVRRTFRVPVSYFAGEIRINLTKFKEGIEMIDLTEEVGSSSEEVVKMWKSNRNKSYNINKLTPPPSLRLEEIPPTSTFPPQPIYHPLTPKQNEKMKEVLDIKYKELEESKPVIKVLEKYVIYKKKLDEILIAFEMEGEDDWLGSFEVGRDEDGNVKYGLVAPSFIDIEDDMERELAMEAYFNPFKNIEAMKDMGHTRKLMAMEIGMLERHAYCEKLSKLQERRFGVPRVANWCLFESYGFEITLKEMMKLEYIYEGDGDVFVDYSWERAILIDDEIYPEWSRVGKPTLTNHKEVLVKEPLMRIMHKVIVGSLVHREASKERCQTWDLWMMSALEESRYYVTRIASFFGYCEDDKIKKCSEPIDYKCYTSRMLVDELDEENTCLKKEAGIPTQTAEGSSG